MSDRTLLIQINVTRDCNLRCTHCYISSEIKTESLSMDSRQWLSIIDKIYEFALVDDTFDHYEIHCVGGEPSMLGVNFFEEVIPRTREILNKVNKRISLMLISNLLTPDSLKIARLFNGVSTSFEYESRFTKNKHQERWEDNVKTLTKEDNVEIGVTTCMTQHILDAGASKIFNYFIDNLGLKKIHFGFFIPSGDGQANSDSLFPKFESTSEFLIDATNLYMQYKSHDDSININPIESFMYAYSHNEVVEDVICPIISGSLDINWDGNVVSCIELGGNKGTPFFGNIFESSIAELMATTGYRKEVFKAKRSNNICMECSEFHVCQGACGILHQHWDGTGECPGFKTFLEYIKHQVKEGVGNRRIANA